jgi:hypothetical protein
MKSYFSLDIETGGLNPYSALVEIGLVYETGEGEVGDLPSFRAVILPERRTSPSGISDFRWNGDWSEGAMAIHRTSGLYEELTTAEPDGRLYFQSRKEAFLAAENWMAQVSDKSRFASHRLAGKNLAVFDLPVLAAHGWRPRYSHRVLDVGTLYLPYSTSGWIPTLSECLDIAGITNESVTHYAIDDARAVIAAIRWATNRLT